MKLPAPKGGACGALAGHGNAQSECLISWKGLEMTTKELQMKTL
jgi:hypothetical protein